MALTEDERLELQEALMRADLKLKDRQGFWETPRNIAILLTAVAAVAGFLGWKVGQTPSAPTQIIFQPGSIVVPQAAPSPK